MKKPTAKTTKKPTAKAAPRAAASGLKSVLAKPITAAKTGGRSAHNSKQWQIR